MVDEDTPVSFSSHPLLWGFSRLGPVGKKTRETGQSPEFLAKHISIYI
jgi:hypothetical protein